MRSCDAMFARRALNRLSRPNQFGQLTDRINFIFNESGSMPDSYNRVATAIKDIFADSDDDRVLALLPKVRKLIEHHRPLRENSPIERQNDYMALSELRQDLTRLISQIDNSAPELIVTDVSGSMS